AGLQQIYTGHMHPESIQHAAHLREHLPNLELHSAQMEQQLADQRERHEAQRLATQLEVETLRRSLALHTQRLHAKEQESTWLRRHAEALEDELLHLQGRRAPGTAGYAAHGIAAARQ
ncbi:Hcn1, partial [Symbiodinium pilosum]